MRFGIGGVLLLMALSGAAHGAISEVEIRRVAVVCGSGAAWTEQHAAGELARYLGQMGRVEAPVITSSRGSRARSLMLVGTVRGNPAIRALVEKGLLRLPSRRESEGFVIRGVTASGQPRLVLCGNDEIGSLYAVYHYLEELCGAGFFQDGEYIPSRDTVPFSGVNISAQPFFRLRKTPAPVGSRWGLKRNHTRFWSVDDWKRHFDWAAKRKLNLSDFHCLPLLRLAGDTFQQAFPEVKPEVVEPIWKETGGFAHGLDWPPAYRGKLSQERIAYGRKVGLRFFYAFDLGSVTFRFQEAHPDMKYMPPSIYGRSQQLRPDDPNAIPITEKYMRKIFENFGTDHMYMSTPFCEGNPGANHEEQLMLKMTAARDLMKVMKELDPKAVWITDTWDFGFEPDGPGKMNIWNRDAIKRYVTLQPKDSFLIYDTNADIMVEPALSEENNYFYGQPWAFGVLNSFSGLDNPHGDIGEVMRRIQNVARNSVASKNCQGLFMVPELTGESTLFWHLITLMAWDPDRFDSRDEYLRYYALHRYGSEAAPTMFKSLVRFADAFHSGNLAAGRGDHSLDRDPDERWYYRPFYRSPWGAWQEGSRTDLGRINRRLRLVREAIELALTQEKRQSNNPLWERDMVDMARAYLGEVGGYHFLRLRYAVEDGDGMAARKEIESGHITGPVEAVEQLLSTRPEFSLKLLIDEVMSVPGTSPYVPEMIRQDLMNWDYAVSDAVEQIHFYCLPRLRILLEKAGGEKAVGARKPSWDEDLRKPFEDVEESWRKGPCELGKSESFHGSSVEAVKTFFHKYRDYRGASKVEESNR